MKVHRLIYLQSTLVSMYNLTYFQASQSKHDGRIVDVKKYSRRAVLLNVVGGVLHILFIITTVIIFIAVFSVLLSQNS